jgi:hypothetical protein
MCRFKLLVAEKQAELNDRKKAEEIAYKDETVQLMKDQRR